MRRSAYPARPTLADPGTPTPSTPPGPVRDRDVVLSAAMVVAFVLAVAWLTGLVPALDDAIGFGPLIIVALISVTVFVLARALLPRRG